MAKCLYCDSDGNTREHVIPAAFSEFRDAPELQAPVCSACNNQRLGLLDEQVARCGPEGFMREFYGVKGRDHHTPVNPFARGSAGGSRLEFSTFDQEVGVEVNLEIREGVVTQMCELILVETETGLAHHFPAHGSDDCRSAPKCNRAESRSETIRDQTIVLSTRAGVGGEAVARTFPRGGIF